MTNYVGCSGMYFEYLKRSMCLVIINITCIYFSLKFLRLYDIFIILYAFNLCRLVPIIVFHIKCVLFQIYNLIDSYFGIKLLVEPNQIFNYSLSKN